MRAYFAIGRSRRAKTCQLDDELLLAVSPEDLELGLPGVNGVIALATLKGSMSFCVVFVCPGVLFPERCGSDVGLLGLPLM